MTTNLKQVFEHTNWNVFRRQKASLIAARDYAVTLKRLQTARELEELLEWLGDLQEAASADGFPALNERGQK